MEKIKGLLNKTKCNHFIISLTYQQDFEKKCPECGGYALGKEPTSTFPLVRRKV